MVDVHIGKNNDVLRSLTNKNKLVRFYQGFVDGIKTGYTRQALYCVSLTAKKNNLRLISVIMGAPDLTTRTKEAKKLLDYGFANYSSYSIAKSGDIITELSVSKGEKNNIKVVSSRDISVLIKKGEDKKIKKEIKLPEMLSAPIKKDQQIGEMLIYKEDKEIAKLPLVAGNDINKSSFIVNLRKSIEYWFGTSK